MGNLGGIIKITNEISMFLIGTLTYHWYVLNYLSTFYKARTKDTQLFKHQKNKVTVDTSNNSSNKPIDL